MGSLKWDVVKSELEELEAKEKLKYVKQKLSKYEKDSKYGPAFRYLGVQLLKYVLDCVKKQSGEDVVVLNEIALQVVDVLGEETEVRNYLNKLAPHLILAVASCTKTKEEAESLCELAEGLYGIISTFSKQISNNSIVSALLKTVSKMSQDRMLFGSALLYLPLVGDSKPFSNIAANTLILIRDIDTELRSHLSLRLWSLVEWCLEEQITSRLPDLILLLIQYDISDGTLDIDRADKVLELYSEHLSLHSLTALFQLVRDITSSVTSSDLDLTKFSLPAPGYEEVFGTTHKETIWILLAVSQHLCFCLLRTKTIPSSWLQIVLHISTLLYRSPQESVREKSSELLTHVYQCHVTDISLITESEESFRTFMSLQMLTIQNLQKTSISGEEYTAKLCEIAKQTDSTYHVTEILELAARVPDVVLSSEHRLKLAALYRSQGHISDAISLLKEDPEPSSSSSLTLVYCMISKLDCEAAISVLDKIETCDEKIQSSVNVLKTYSSFVSSLKLREPFTISNPAQFCKDAKCILTSDSPDDCLLSVLTFLAGLHGLSTVVARCAARLSPRPENLVSVLSSVPALLANRTEVTWSHDLSVLSSPDSKRHDIEDVLEEAEEELDKETDKVTEKSLLCGVCGLVLIDRALRAGEEVYDISEKCMSLTLQAAHTKLKSWKRTAMSSRALLWQNCAMIPYTLHVLARYISLLFTWGSVHQTTLYLDRLEQLAKFSRSDYWISKHRNLSAFVRITLKTLVAKVPAPLPESQSEHSTRDNEYLSECQELERYRAAESEVLRTAAERNNRTVQTGGSKAETVAGEEDTGDSVYPVFSTSLSPSHLTRLILLQLELSWSIAPPSQESLVEYFHSLKRSIDSWSSGKSSKSDMHHTSVPADLEKQARAWLSVLSDCQPAIPEKVEEESKVKVPARRGRSRNNSNSKTAVKQTTVRTTRRTAGKRQAVNKKSQVKKEEPTNHILSGLDACRGLEPVFVKRELLKRKIKRAPSWQDVEEYNNVPFKHQIRDVIKKYDDVTHFADDVTVPESWTFASIMQIDGALYLGQKRSGREVVFKRELPFCLKSAGVGGENTSCLDEMRRIICSNDDSVTHSTDKVKFWKSRYQLNSRLEDMIDRLESDWLGPWKGLLLGSPVDPSYQKLVREGAAQLRAQVKANHKVKVELSEFMSEYVLDCYSILTEEHLTELLVGLPVQEILTTIHNLAPPAAPLRHPTLLSLGPELDLLPWESCKVYRNQPISRVPSTNFVLTLQKLRNLPVKLNKEQTFYILNPTQNLPSTQACFESWLAEQEGWRGVAAKPPSLPEYQDGLKSDMFLYLGHGSGKEFLAGKPIQELDSRAVALLMGCSSGKIKHTPVGGIGTPVEYMLSGCPAVLGYLWNITDRDCDRFSKKLLELWLAEGNTISLLSLMNPSREACKLPFLVGAAPVLYGVPDILTSQNT